MAVWLFPCVEWQYQRACTNRLRYQETSIEMNAGHRSVAFAGRGAELNQEIISFRVVRACSGSILLCFQHNEASEAGFEGSAEISRLPYWCWCTIKQSISSSIYNCITTNKNTQSLNDGATFWTLAHIELWALRSSDAGTWYHQFSQSSLIV